MQIFRGESSSETMKSDITFPFFHNLLSENPNLKPIVSPPLSKPLLLQTSRLDNDNANAFVGANNNISTTQNYFAPQNDHQKPNPFSFGPSKNMFNNLNTAFNPFAIPPPKSLSPSLKPFWSNQNTLSLVKPKSPSSSSQPSDDNNNHDEDQSPTFNFLGWGLNPCSPTSSKKSPLPDDDVEEEVNEETSEEEDDDDEVEVVTVLREPDARAKRLANRAAKKAKRNDNLVNVVKRAHKKSAQIVKGQWSPQEDKCLLRLVGKYGTRKWSKVAKIMSKRVGKQCRERWHNHLRPDIRKDTWSEEEDLILIRSHMALGNRWAEIARRLPGRSENTIKNHWNATKRRQNAKKMRNRDISTMPNVSQLQLYIRSLSLQTPFSVAGAETVPSSGDESEEYDQSSEFGSGSGYGGDDVAVEMNEVESLFPDGNAYRTFLEEMSLNESSVDIQMRNEIESLMRGPGQVKQEMDLMNMIVQGRI